MEKVFKKKKKKKSLANIHHVGYNHSD